MKILTWIKGLFSIRRQVDRVLDGSNSLKSISDDLEYILMRMDKRNEELCQTMVVVDEEINKLTQAGNILAQESRKVKAFRKSLVELTKDTI